MVLLVLIWSSGCFVFLRQKDTNSPSDSPNRPAEPFAFYWPSRLTLLIVVVLHSQPLRTPFPPPPIAHPPAMADTYLSFLRSPTESALAPDAALHYITTTTSIHDAPAIIKHFQTQERVVKKKSETVLSSYGSPDGAVVETETTFEFVRGGGAVLPRMDDNMLADSIASVPMVGTIPSHANALF